VAIDQQRLLEAQKALMDSMIKIMAGAIDAKSPYTGGHCERVQCARGFTHGHRSFRYRTA